MKFSTLLLSTTAIVAAGAAFAADLPAKKAAPAAAAPQQGCPAFGAGYFPIPGSDMCLQITGHVRSDTSYTSNVTRPTTAPYSFGYKVNAFFNVIGNSEFGNVKSTAGLNTNSTIAGAVIVAQASAQIGGFTAGYAPSPVDFSNGYNNSGLAYQPGGVAQLAYTASLGGTTTLTVAATTAQSKNMMSATTTTYDTTVTASRPDVMAVLSTTSGPMAFKLGAVSHEVVGATTGTSQGMAVLGRADLTVDKFKLIGNAAYASGALGYMGNGSGTLDANYAPSGLGSVMDSDASASNLGTASMGMLGIEADLSPTAKAYAYGGSVNASENGNSYSRTVYGMGLKYTMAKGFYLRPEIYQQATNDSQLTSSTTTTTANVVYLRIRRDF